MIDQYSKKKMYIQFIDFIEDHSIYNIIHHITKEAKSIAENHEKGTKVPNNDRGKNLQNFARSQ